MGGEFTYPKLVSLVLTHSHIPHAKPRSFKDEAANLKLSWTQRNNLRAPLSLPGREIYAHPQKRTQTACNELSASFLSEPSGGPSQTSGRQAIVEGRREYDSLAEWMAQKKSKLYIYH